MDRYPLARKPPSPARAFWRERSVTGYDETGSLLRMILRVICIWRVHGPSSAHALGMRRDRAWPDPSAAANARPDRCVDSRHTFAADRVCQSLPANQKVEVRVINADPTPA